jgi:hypothetical protein
MRLGNRAGYGKTVLASSLVGSRLAVAHRQRMHGS